MSHIRLGHDEEDSTGTDAASYNQIHQSSANLLAEAAETIQHDDFEKRVAEAVDGEEFNALLESLPFSVYGDGQSHTYNRVIKVLVREGIIGKLLLRTELIFRQVDVINCILLRCQR
jgi:hypothetical protein